MGTREGAPERSGALDFFRAVWACGIVHFHLGESYKHLAYGALPAFLIVLLQLSERAATRQPFPEFARKRAARLLVPWLVWSAVYAALQTVTSLDSDPFGWFRPNMVLYGTLIHLWFLPAAFVLSCLSFPLARLRLRAPRAAFVVAGVGAAASIALMVAHLDPNLMTPINQVRFALPSLFLAVLLPSVVAGRAPADAAAPAQRLALEYAGAAIVGAILIAALLLTKSPTGHLVEAEAMTYVVGVATFLAARWIRIPATPLIRALGSAAFLVYLMHPLVARVIAKFLKTGFHSDLLSIVTMIASLIAAILINAAIARYAGRFARLAHYVGAEALDFMRPRSPKGESGGAGSGGAPASTQ